MAEDAKNPTADKSVDEKGQAQDKTTQKKKTSRARSAKGTKTKAAKATTKTEVAETEVEKDAISTDTIEEKSEDPNADTEKSDTPSEVINEPEISDQAEKDNISEDFQAEIRDQIENCKFEIVASLQESVHAELKNIMRGQVRKVERRRLIGVIIRDIVILILAAVVGYFGYCLYDVKYFDFLKPVCEQNSTCEPTAVSQPEPPEEIVKDLAWYRANYGELFDNLQTKLNADKISAYYLYSGDYKVSEIPAEYLLGMAYNQLSPAIYNTNNSIIIPANDLRTAFVDTFGTSELFVKHSFSHDCLDFDYDKMSDSFTAPNLTCENNSSTRQIVEEITDIYEEGNVLYFQTVAAVFDNSENTFYTFDNLFRPAATNVSESDLEKYTGTLNQYQYTFKRVNDQYYFSSIIKLK